MPVGSGRAQNELAKHPQERRGGGGQPSALHPTKVVSLLGEKAAGGRASPQLSLAQKRIPDPALKISEGAHPVQESSVHSPLAGQVFPGTEETGSFVLWPRPAGRGASVQNQRGFRLPEGHVRARASSKCSGQVEGTEIKKSRSPQPQEPPRPLPGLTPGLVARKFSRCRCRGDCRQFSSPGKGGSPTPSHTGPHLEAPESVGDGSDWKA